jgi:hypothetical protein
MGITTNNQKVYTKVNLHEQKNDFAHSQTQPYQVRPAALEQIHREFHQWSTVLNQDFKEFIQSQKWKMGPTSN